MIFGKKRLHKLPAFPPNAASIFKRLCAKIPVEKLPELEQELRQNVAELIEASKGNRKLDISLVDVLFDRSLYLLRVYPDVTPLQQSYIIGAIRYFVMEDDVFSELEFATGLNDDIQIMNHVLEEVGSTDFIPLSS